jgi:Protein of unknown function DUF262/Protein of unknown function (DUF1524)
MPSFDAFPKSLGQTLTGNIGPAAKPIVVPPWQRSFAWRDTEVDQFWNDLVAFSEGCSKQVFGRPQYFLGSIVLVTEDEAATHLLLDGQQRLVTSTILLAAIRDYIIETADADDSDARELAMGITRQFIVAKDLFSAQDTNRLTLNEYDEPYFRDFIQKPAGGTSDLSVNASLDSHKRLRKAYQTLIKRLREHIAAVQPAEGGIKWAHWLAGVLTQNIVLIVATSDDEDTAAEIFETLNDRGVGLSTPDLLRNLLLRKAPQGATAEIIDYWRDILRIEEARTDLFLRHFWISRQGDVKKHSLYREMRDHLNANPAPDYPLRFTKQLAEDAQVYQDLVSGRDDDDDVQALLIGANLLDAFTLRPALLSAWEVGETNDRKRLLRALIAFFVRHRVIVGLENNEFERIVFSIAKKLRDTEDFDGAITALQAAPPGDEEFEAAFAGAVVTRQNTVRYLLMEFERARHQHQELSVEAASKVHIEHIYPRNPPQAWRAENHEQIVSRLGNFTLLGKKLNASLQNAKFADKRDNEARGYKVSDLKITRELALAPYDELEYWTVDQINERQEMLAQEALEIWKI